MSKITIEDVKKVANLAKLQFSDQEIEKFTEQFERIVGFVEKIGKLNTENIDLMVYPMENKNVFREDTIISSMQNKEIEKIAPSFSNGSIVVPKIIDY